MLDKKKERDFWKEKNKLIDGEENLTRHATKKSTRKKQVSRTKPTLQKRKTPDSEIYFPTKKVKPSTYDQEQDDITIDVLHNDNLETDSKIVIDERKNVPFDLLPNEISTEIVQNNVIANHIDQDPFHEEILESLPPKELTKSPILTPHRHDTNLLETIINVDNVPSGSVLIVTPKSPSTEPEMSIRIPHDAQVSFSVPRMTRQQAKKDASARLDSIGNSYKSISKLIDELSRQDPLHGQPLHARKIAKKPAESKERAPKINTKKEKSKKEKSKKEKSKKEKSKKEKSKHFVKVNNTTLKINLKEALPRESNNNAFHLNHNDLLPKNPSLEHIKSKLNEIKEKPLAKPVFSSRYNHFERETYWYKDLKENNTLSDPVYWHYESSLPSFLFDKRCKFTFDKRSFLNFNHLQEKPKKIPHKLENIYGPRLDILKRKLSLHGYHSSRYSESDYVFFGAGVDRYYSGRAQNHIYVYKALTRDQLKRLTTVFEKFYDNLAPEVIKDGVRVDSQRLIFQKERIVRGTVTLGNVIKLKQPSSTKEKDIITEKIFQAICQQLSFFLDYGFIVKGGSVREEELKPDNFLIRRTEATASSVTFEIIFIDIKHLVYVGFPNG